MKACDNCWEIEPSHAVTIFSADVVISSEGHEDPPMREASLGELCQPCIEALGQRDWVGLSKRRRQSPTKRTRATAATETAADAAPGETS